MSTSSNNPKGVAEQENLLSTIVEGLNQVGDALPRAEISALLYPVPRMKTAVSKLYAYIIKFLVRAFNWFCEGKLLHAYHSIARPAVLRYDGLITKIREASAEISALASIGSQAEQRDMHLELRSLSDEVQAIAGTLSKLLQIAKGEQTVNAATRLDFQQSFYELKISQIFAVLTTGSSLDPQKTLSACCFLRNRRRQGSTSYNIPQWVDHNMHTWNNQKDSAMFLLGGSVTARSKIIDFCADLVEYLQANKVAVLWIFKGLDTSRPGSISVADVLKNLILQALQIRSAKLQSGVDAVVAQQLPNFLNARTEEEWLDILAPILRSFSVIYLVIDTKAISSREQGTGKAPEDQGLLVDTIVQLFEKLTVARGDNGHQSIVKVVLAHYGPVPLTSRAPKASDEGSQKFVVHVGRKRRPGGTQASSRPLARSVPSKPQYAYLSQRGTKGLSPRSKKKKRTHMTGNE